MSNLEIFPRSITAEEQFLLNAYSRLQSAQDALKKVKEFKKIELSEQKINKLSKPNSNLGKNAVAAKSNTDKIKQLVASGKLDIGQNKTENPEVNTLQFKTKEGFRRRRPQKGGKNDNNPGNNPVSHPGSRTLEDAELEDAKQHAQVAHERIKIFAGPGITEEKISQVFTEFGRIKHIKLLGHGTTIDTALVSFEHTDSAVEAVKKMNGCDHDDFVAKLRVSFTRKQSDTVKNVFQVNRKPQQAEDPEAHGRTLVKYDEETDLFD